VVIAEINHGSLRLGWHPAPWVRHDCRTVQTIGSSSVGAASGGASVFANRLVSSLAPPEYAALTGLKIILGWISTEMSRLTALGTVIISLIFPPPNLFSTR
jgi:hypothetical protein